MEANLPAVRGRVQQRDGHQLGEPGRSCAAAIPRHETVSLRASGILSDDERAPALPRAIQHPGSNGYDTINRPGDSLVRALRWVQPCGSMKMMGHHNSSGKRLARSLLGLRLLIEPRDSITIVVVKRFYPRSHPLWKL